MMTEEKKYQSRILQLKNQANDLRLPDEIYEKIFRVIDMTLQNYSDIDPYILDLEESRLEEIKNLVQHPLSNTSEGVMLRLSHLDIFDLEKIILCAEGYYKELGGDQALHMSPSDLASLTEKIAVYRKKAFPEVEDGGA